MTPTDVRGQLIRDEGVRLRPYPDTEGKLTIGIGRCLSTKGISAKEAQMLFENDLGDVAADVEHTLPWSGALDDARRAVLLNMAFNLGMTGLLGFQKMLHAAQGGEYALAAREMRNSTWAAQVGDRAERLALQMEDGQWR